MRSVSSIFLVLLFLLGSCVGESDKEKASFVPFSKQELIEVNKSDLTLVSGKGQVFYNGLPFNGFSVKYYENGQPEEKIAYKKGKKERVYRKWYDDGTQSYEAHYKANKINGKVRSWWPNGVLRSESTMIHGVMHGVHRQWYPSGALFKEMHLNHGKEEGMQRAWRENGKLYNNYEAKNGRIFGLKRSQLCYELESEVVQISD